MTTKGWEGLGIQRWGEPEALWKSRLVKKKIVAVFFSVRGDLEQVVLETRKTVAEMRNCQSSQETVPKLKDGSPKFVPNIWPALEHQCPDTPVLEHPPYCPDLAPCNLLLFTQLKNRLKGRRFVSNDDLLDASDDECAQPSLIKHGRISFKTGFEGWRIYNVWWSFFEKW